MYLVKNCSQKEYIKLFSTNFYIEENELNKIDITTIETMVETECIEKGILSISDICCANILLLFTISLKSLSEKMDCQAFLGILFQKFTSFRKYYSILLRMVYKLCQESVKQKKYKNIANTALCCYPCINAIRSKRLVPNEDLMGMITQFNTLNIKDFMYPEKKEKEENEKKEEEKEKEYNKENEEKINLEEIKLYGNQLEEKDISGNLYVYYNFSSERFYKEEELMQFVNKEEKDKKEEIPIITHPNFPSRIRFYNGIHKMECSFLSQKEILEKLTKECKKFMETLDYSKINPRYIVESCLNIFIYIRNAEEFEGMDDVFQTLQSIFYIFVLFIPRAQ